MCRRQGLGWPNRYTFRRIALQTKNKDGTVASELEDVSIGLYLSVSFRLMSLVDLRFTKVAVFIPVTSGYLPPLTDERSGVSVAAFDC